MGGESDIFFKASVRRAVIFGLVALAGLLAVWLRLEQALAPISFDELASMYFSRRPFNDLWGPWLLRETNPPLFYSLLKLWRAVAPEDAFALRLLPLAFSLAQIGLLAWFVRRRYGWLAALVAVLLFALSPSDVYQSSYLRGYGLAKLAVTIAFLGLVRALEDAPDGSRGASDRGWAAYVFGSVIAIYSHTTMLLWPAVAAVAVLVEAVWRRGIDRHRIASFLIANIAIVAMAAWEIWVAVEQMRAGSGNIAWIMALSLDDFSSTANLQLLLAGWISSILMAALMLVGVLRTFRQLVTRLSLTIVVATVLAFRLADQVHPIVTDFTMHWCATFTVILAAGALANWKEASRSERRWRRVAPPILATAAVCAVFGDGLFEYREDGMIPEPQDWGYVVETVAHVPGAALLASHESIGVMIDEACRLRFHRDGCPFAVVVMRNSAPTDSWATGGYGAPLVPAAQVRAALGRASEVFAFSRYVYTPLEPLGLDPGDYREVQWDDGELIGPIPIEDFDRPGTG